jgi:hypothetical protein
MNAGQTTEAFHQEIAALEAKLAAKKQELLTAGVESPEKAIFKQVVREHAEPASPTQAQQPVTPTSSSSTPQSLTPAQTQQLNLLLAHAFTHGLAAAIAEAKKTGDAFFVDMLHDRLVDEYYDRLLAARKISSS